MAPANAFLKKRGLPQAALMLLRVTAAVLGGYALNAAVVALMVGLLATAGLARAEAVVLASMLGFVFYLGALLWAFSVRSLASLWAVLVLGTAGCAFAALQFMQV